MRYITKVHVAVICLIIFLISNHLIDLCDWAENYNTSLYNGGMWEINNIILLKHIMWYVSYICFFVLVFLVIGGGEKCCK